jgi:hypothetical protein
MNFNKIIDKYVIEIKNFKNHYASSATITGQ